MNKIIAGIHLFTFLALLTAPTTGFAKSISEIVRENNDAVVLVLAFDRDQKPLGIGSGFFVKTDGVLVTSYHAIEDAYTIWVKISNGGLFDVKDILNIDEQGDIAVLKVHGRNLPVVKMGDPREMRVGDAVVAIGHPLVASISLEMDIATTTTEGILSARRTVRKSGRQFLQISAPVSPGSSGGLLLNMEGETIGMTTATATEGQNINFAVPINQIKDVIFGRRQPVALSESAKLFFSDGLLAFGHRDFDAAEHYFKKTLEKDPKHALAHILLGLVYHERNLYDLELQHYEEAARIDPNNLFAHYYLALAYENKGLLDQAIKQFEAVLEIDPKHKRTLYSLGVLYITQGNKKKAWGVYASLQELNPGQALKLKRLIEVTK